MPAPEPASASDAQPAPAAEAPERTPAEPTTGDARVAASADAGSSPEVDAEGVRARDQADLREGGGQAAADEPAPRGVQDAPTTDGAAEEPEQRAPAAQSAPPIGRPGTTGRGRDASDPDPWQSLGDDEDEAMLGAWTHRAASAPFATASTGTTETDPAVGAAQRDAPRAEPRAAPPAAAPGGRPASATAPTFEPSEPPHVVVDRDEDDDEDEGWTYGLRDPFAEV